MWPSAFLHGVGAPEEVSFAAQYPARPFPCQRFAAVLTNENRPGTFAGIAEKLAQARINIKCVYVSGEAGNQLVVLSVANADKASQVLGG